MASAQQPLVSVITPFFNTDAYLAEAIESVLAQTHRNFEYLLVDNRSTDRSVEIAERFAARDTRVRLLHNEEFVPQLRNYNQALRRISPDSRYVKIVQADDAIFPRCLEAMVAVAEANPTVGVVSSRRRVGDGIGPLGIGFTKTVMSGREACRANLIDDLFLFGSPTTIMVRADIVRRRQPFYDEDDFFADADAVYEILRDHDFAFVHEVLSFMRVEKGSIGGRMKAHNPLILDRLRRLKSFGPAFLTPEENGRLLAEHRRKYRRFLAEAWLRRREPAFWEFHQKGLAPVGESIDRGRFALDAVPVVLYFALRPWRFVAWLLRRGRKLVEQP